MNRNSIRYVVASSEAARYHKPGMTWTKVTHVRGFSGAEAVYVADGWLIALWNHEKCCGWQLYSVVERPMNCYQRSRWVVGAGSESLGWTDAQAQEWAEKMVASQNG